MSIFSAKGATQAERERNAGVRLLLRTIAESVNSAVVSSLLRNEVLAIRAERTLTGIELAIIVGSEITRKELLKYRLSMLATLVTLFAAEPYKTIVDGLEIECANDTIIERLKLSEHFRKALMESCVCTLPKPQALTEYVAERIG